MTGPSGERCWRHHCPAPWPAAAADSSLLGGDDGGRDAVVGQRAVAARRTGRLVGLFPKWIWSRLRNCHFRGGHARSFWVLVATRGSNVFQPAGPLAVGATGVASNDVCVGRAAGRDPLDHRIRTHRRLVHGYTLGHVRNQFMGGVSHRRHAVVAAVVYVQRLYRMVYPLFFWMFGIRSMLAVSFSYFDPVDRAIDGGGEDDRSLTWGARLAALVGRDHALGFAGNRPCQIAWLWIFGSPGPLH